MNGATARWIGHRWAFSGYIPEFMPPLVNDLEPELLPSPPCGGPPCRAKTRRTHKKAEPEPRSRDGIKMISCWKRMGSASFAVCAAFTRHSPA